MIHKPQAVTRAVLFDRRRYLGPCFICEIGIDVVSRRQSNRIDIVLCSGTRQPANIQPKYLSPSPMLHCNLHILATCGQE
jgi:hypothetical protein